MRKILVVLSLVAASAVAGLDASDRIGVYGVLDKVVFEPPSGAPDRVQLWGAFAVAKRGDANDYDPVQRGYLYFALGDSRDLARREWNDLKRLADGKNIVAFSSRFGQSVRLRSGQEKPQAPDAYVVGLGVQTMRPDSSYAPVHELASRIRR
jgi:hypothetical protein